MKLISKKNGDGRISSYVFNISLSEAKQLNLDANSILVKEIVNDKLVISRAFPQTSEDFLQILTNFQIIGKRLSKKMLLELLYFIENDSESYRKQKSKTYDSIRCLKKHFIGYKGQYAFFMFKLKMNKNRIIEDCIDIESTQYPEF